MTYVNPDVTGVNHLGVSVILNFYSFKIIISLPNMEFIDLEASEDSDSQHSAYSNAHRGSPPASPGPLPVNIDNPVMYAEEDYTSKSTKTARKYVFTLNRNLDEFKAWWAALDKEDFKGKVNYFVFQEEIAPRTGNPHIQGYINLKSPCRGTTLKKLIHRDVWFQVARGDDVQNQAYCTKDDTRAPGGMREELGRPQAQGARNDIEEFVQAAKKTKLQREMWDSHPRMMAKFPRVYEQVREAYAEPREEPPVVKIYWGPTGTGKSRKALAEAKAEGYFAVKSDGDQWWPGLINGCNLVIEDLEERTWFGGGDGFVNRMLHIMDRTPFTVQVRSVDCR